MNSVDLKGRFLSMWTRFTLFMWVLFVRFREAWEIASEGRVKMIFGRLSCLREEEQNRFFLHLTLGSLGILKMGHGWCSLWIVTIHSTVLSHQLESLRRERKEKGAE